MVKDFVVVSDELGEDAAPVMPVSEELSGAVIDEDLDPPNEEEIEYLRQMGGVLDETYGLASAYAGLVESVGVDSVSVVLADMSGRQYLADCDVSLFSPSSPVERMQFVCAEFVKDTSTAEERLTRVRVYEGKRFEISEQQYDEFLRRLEGVEEKLREL